MSIIRRWQSQTQNPWLRFMIGSLNILLWANVARFLFTVLIWILGHSFGDGRPFQLEWWGHLEWTIVLFSTVNGFYWMQRLFSAKSSAGRAFVKALGTWVGMVIGGVLVDMNYQLIWPMLGYIYDLNLVYFDIELPAYVTNTVTYAFIGLFAGIPVLIQHHRQEKHLLELKVKELEMQRLEQLKDSARLEALQAKINPHFLYNSLNSIVSLIHEEPNRAEEMIVALSGLFRYSLHSAEGNYATVGEELKMAEVYLKIEKIRFDENLHYQLKMDPAAASYLIPKFVIQPLLENAIKHGISKIGQGEIHLSITLQKDLLQIEVEDNGPPFQANFASGYGLLSIQEKLDLLFPEASGMEIQPKNPKKVILTFSQLLTHAPAL